MSSLIQSLLVGNDVDGSQQRSLHKPNEYDQNHTSIKEELDSMLADSVSKMSLDNREKVLEEINGIPQPNREDPAAIDAWLSDLDSCIENNKRGTVYELAEAMDRSLVTSRDFRLMFLRAVRNDPKAAAEKLFKFLDLKRQLFGQAKLVKKITLEDLEKEDIEYVKSGASQILPCKDSAGRQIVIFLAALRNHKTVESELRARFYIFMTLCESQETQRRGITLIFLGLAADKKKNGGNSGLLWSLPIHCAAIHSCFSDYSSFILNSLAFRLFPSWLRRRCRIHYASDYGKCQEILSGFGIPRIYLPTSHHEVLPTKEHHCRWFEQRCKMELESSPLLTKNNEGITSKDVLFGRKRHHEGNVQFRELVMDVGDLYYNTTSKKEKAKISLAIIEKVKSSGGRFLKENENGEWVKAPLGEIKQKVAHTFRNHRRTIMTNNALL